MVKRGVITIVGSIIYDYRIMADRLPRPGETISGYGFGCCSGGKGANQAVAAALLGADVSMVGCIGADNNGDIILSEYQKYGINAEHVTRLLDASTSTCLIHIENGGQNAIIFDGATNNKLSCRHIDEAHGLLSRTNVLLIQNEVPSETNIYAAKLAKAAGAVVIYNPAPAMEISDELFQLADYVTPNETESEFYTGIDASRDVEGASELLIQRGIKNVIITLGKDGSYYAGVDFREHFPAYPVNAIDGTAAGDAFNGALAVMLGEGRNIKEAIRFANAAGAVCAAGQGAQSSLGDRATVELLMKERSNSRK